MARWGGLGESLPEFQSNEVFWVVDGCKSTEQPFDISCENRMYAQVFFLGNAFLKYLVH